MNNNKNNNLIYKNRKFALQKQYYNGILFTELSILSTCSVSDAVKIYYKNFFFNRTYYVIIKEVIN